MSAQRMDLRTSLDTASRWTAGAAATAAGSGAGVAAPPVSSATGADIIRTRVVHLDDESDSSDSELEMQLMRKYGIR